MNPSHYIKLIQVKSTQEWNEWRQNERNVGNWAVDLSGAHIRNRSFLPYEDPDTKRVEGLDLKDVDLRYSNFVGSSLINADFTGSDLTGANFTWANLSHCIFKSVNFSCARFEKTELSGTKIWASDLSGTSFDFSVVDGGTLIFSCDISNSTSFLGVGLHSARIDTEMLPYLQYSIRKKSWENWYRDTIFDIYNEDIGKNSIPYGSMGFINLISLYLFLFYKYIVRLFWVLSDYGGSTLRIVVIFIMVNIIFSLIYYSFGIIELSSPLSSVFICAIPQTLLVIFGVVTVDLSPVTNFLLHLVVVIHVVTGYILLAALVTRLSTIFQSTGPDKLHWRRKFYEK